jgi:hypothetical protein
MKTLILILLFCTFLTSFSQDQKLWVGLNGSIAQKQFDRDKLIYEDELESSLTYGFSIQAQYFLTERLFTNIGLGIEYNNYELPYLFRAADSDDPWVPNKTNAKLNYLNVPIRLGYKISFSDKLSLMPNAGVNFDFLLNSSESTTYEDGHEEDSNVLLTDVTNTVYSVALDFAIDYTLSNRVRINLSPYVTKGLNNIDTEKSLTTPFSYGVKLGVLIGI